MGKQFNTGKFTASMLNLIGQPIVGQYRENSFSSIGDTETTFITSPELTPKANQIYLVLSLMSANYGALTAGDRFFHRIRLNNVSGTELGTATILPQESGASGPFPHPCWTVYESGATPSAVQFAGTVDRFSGDGTLSPTLNSIILVWLLGDTNQFTSA